MKKKKEQKKCVKCGGERYIRLHPITNDLLCGSCKMRIEVVSKTDAIKLYMLSEDDLDNLKFVSSINQRNRSRPIKLFLKSQIIELCNLKN